MKKSFFLLGVVCFVLAISSITMAGMDGKGNGFPSGPHFNMIIHGKPDTFPCPPPKYYYSYNGTLVEVCPEGTEGTTCSLTTTQIYGNVINVPRDWGNGPISILMESGRKGPKSNPSAIELEVTDWCTEDIDGDAAVLRLPQDPDGYAVYARILGKPGDAGDPNFRFTSRELVLVEDEFGNNLLGLGLITPTGTVDFAGNVLTRWDTSKTGKGVQKARNITEIFEFTGKVCAINDQATFCATGGCSDGPLVCCVPFQEVGNGNTTLEEAKYCYDVTVEPPLPALFAACEKLSIDTTGDQVPDVCAPTITYKDADENPVETTNVCTVATQCKNFVNEWIFNIADFVNVLFGIDPEGSYNVQIRFYPLPLQNGQTPYFPAP